MSQNRTNPSMLPLPNSTLYLSVFVYLNHQTSLLVTICIAEPLHSSSYPHFKSLRLSFPKSTSVYVLPTKATLKTKHDFVNLLVSSKFILPVKSLFLSLNTSFGYLLNNFCHLILSCLNVGIGSLVQLPIMLSFNINFHFVLSLWLVAYHLSLFQINIYAAFWWLFR